MTLLSLTIIIVKDGKVIDIVKIRENGGCNVQKRPVCVCVCVCACVRACVRACVCVCNYVSACNVTTMPLSATQEKVHGVCGREGVSISPHSRVSRRCGKGRERIIMIVKHGASLCQRDRWCSRKNVWPSLFGGLGCVGKFRIFSRYHRFSLEWKLLRGRPWAGFCEVLFLFLVCVFSSFFFLEWVFK